MKKQQSVFRKIFLTVMACAAVSAMFGCDQRIKDKQIDKNGKVTITVKGDKNIIVNTAEFTVDKGTKWSAVKTNAAITKITFKDGWELSEWKLNNASGAKLTDDYAFNADTTVFAVSKKKGGTPAEEVTITVQGDDNVKSGKGVSFKVNKGTKWETVKTKTEITGVAFKDGYELSEWKLNNASGAKLTDDYAFNADTTVFACAALKEKPTVQGGIYMTLSPEHMDIEILVTTKDGTPIEVEGCTQTSFESGEIIMLNAKQENIVLKGKIILLVCEDAMLTSLNVQGCPELERLICYRNKLKELDVHGLKKLEELACSENQITNLNAQDCINLDKLDCKFNKIETLNITGCKKLRYLYCEDNCLTFLNLEEFQDLLEAKFENNKLSSLSTKNLKKLGWLDCKNNSLTSLNVEGCNSLEWLNCAKNKLTSVDVKSCKGLIDFYCYENELTSLDLSNLEHLREVNCEENKLTSFKTDGCHSLLRLSVRKNNLPALDVKHLTNLVFLSCHTNKLTSLDLRGLNSLKRIICHTNQLTSLDITDLFQLIEVHCYGNKLKTDALVSILNSLPALSSAEVQEKSKCILYTQKEGAKEENSTDFSNPAALKTAFENAKKQNKWRMFKINSKGDTEEI